MSSRVAAGVGALFVAFLALLLVVGAGLVAVVLPTLADGLCSGPGGAPREAGPGVPGPSSGSTPNGDQLSYAQLITSTVAARGLPEQAAVVAIAAARQESVLGQAGMNVAVDHDSLGLFQQRPSAGWGTPTEVKDPVYATNAFLDHLVRIAGWASMPVTRAAQRVQGSAFPNAYARWESLARSLASRFWPGTRPSAPASAAPAPVAGAVSCPGDGGDGSAPTPGGIAADASAAAPPALPASRNPRQALAVGAALAQLGKPYQWGGVGPSAFDCSGLMLASWRAAGITLPRTAAAQSRFGVPVADVSELEPGDLVFIAGAGGTASAPGHVGMAIGGGRLVHAPEEGEPVQIAPLSRWAGRIVALRRPNSAQPDAPTADTVGRT